MGGGTNVYTAKEAARAWIAAHAGDIAGFVGAFTHGSINWLADDELLAPTSDVDIMLVLQVDALPVKPGKIHYRGVLLELSNIRYSRLEAPAAILADHHLADNLRRAELLADPCHLLSPIQVAVAKDFAQRKWVIARCENAQQKIISYLDSIGATRPFHEQVIGWLFGTGITTHVLLTAGLRNPTVRKRYLATRDLLASYGQLSLYETLLAHLGCAQMRPEQVVEHLDRLAAVFDAAQAVCRSPFSFAADISPAARPLAIDGSRELIEAGNHREAVFWIAVTFSRCQVILEQDAPARLFAQHRPAYLHLLRDLGIESTEDLLSRAAQVRAYLPSLWAHAQEFLDHHPDIKD